MKIGFEIGGGLAAHRDSEKTQVYDSDRANGERHSDEMKTFDNWERPSGPFMALAQGVVVSHSKNESVGTKASVARLGEARRQKGY